MAVGGGGSGAAGLGGGERVGEHQRRSRELATGSFWREEGWRRGLRGELGGGGGHGGRRWSFQAKGGARRWLSSSGGKKEMMKTSLSSRNGLRAQGRETGRGVAGSLGSDGGLGSAAQNRGGRERREREIEIDWFKIESLSKIPFETW